MTITDIIALTGSSKATIYRWITHRGFPPGDAGTWERAAVEAWWRDNKNKVGRHPK